MATIYPSGRVNPPPPATQDPSRRAMSSEAPAELTAPKMHRYSTDPHGGALA